jgi:single-stranded DNA-binding protein
MKIIVVGKLSTARFVDKENKNRTLTFIDVDEHHFCENKSATSHYQPTFTELEDDEDLPF